MPRKPASTGKSAKKKAKKPPGRAAAKKAAKRAPPARPRPAKKAAAKAKRAPPRKAPPPKKATAKAKAAILARKAKAAAKPEAAPKAKAPAPKAAKPAKKRGTKKTAGAARPGIRLKIVWAVCDHSLKVLKTFPYPERRAAELEAQRLQKAKGKEHVVRAERVPMTD